MQTADLLVHDAELIATVDDGRREVAGGWVAVTDGVVSALGGPGVPQPEALRRVDARGCLVTPGLVNTHHHLYQNLTRAYAPALTGGLFDWLVTLYPLWARLDEEAASVSAFVGLTELALSGCTTSTDHLYVHPRGAGDLISAEVAAARELGMRFHPTRGSMSLSVKDGGLPPDSVVQDDDEILAESQRLVEAYHDRSATALTRIALAPCSPFSVSTSLMRRTAELAESLDVRLHTHLAETADEDAFCLETFGRRPVDYLADVGWMSDRVWLAHVVWPDAGEVARLGAARVGAAHCPSSNMILGSGLAPVAELRAAGAPVGLGVDGSASADSASLWLEARIAMLQGKLRQGAAAMSARDALEMATRGGAECLGRTGEIGQLSVGACGDLAVWSLEGVRFAGALSDPVEAWLRCGPVAARHTVVGGRFVVEDGVPVHPGLDEQLAVHRRVSARMQAALA
ncbi:Cytosine/adenosine deaminase [Modestobacter sp. DSM 44400]|uniref:8-oxoguanine deaminase n=1 Tax=Modestobacter sp. DSM 44400 TaxID=1550230 RepID=UPI0008997B30|nr:8-oxoguanine deaminase [Modestobacter sp. DSM 44400]SDY70551.1 Cytosine/adenosine deaminase [Modestobacter sp. DSM 44400]